MKVDDGFPGFNPLSCPLIVTLYDPRLDNVWAIFSRPATTPAAGNDPLSFVPKVRTMHNAAALSEGGPSLFRHHNFIIIIICSEGDIGAKICTPTTTATIIYCLLFDQFQIPLFLQLLKSTSYFRQLFLLLPRTFVNVVSFESFGRLVNVQQ